MLRIACCDDAPNCSCPDPWLELYSRRHRPGGGFPNGSALGWKRRPAPRWGRWRGLQLDRSRRKRWSVWAQPEPRWRHADGVAVELERSRELELQLGAQYGHEPRPALLQPPYDASWSPRELRALRRVEERAARPEPPGGAQRAQNQGGPRTR